MADDVTGVNLSTTGDEDHQKTSQDIIADQSQVDPEAVIGRKSLSAAMGESFWLAIMWLLIVAVLAVTANLWPLPEYDHMDWLHQAAMPGTESRAPIKESRGKTTESDFVYLLGTDTMNPNPY